MRYINKKKLQLFSCFTESNLLQASSTGFDDDDWSVDVSAEAVAARMSEISSGVATLALSEDLERTPSERANMLYAFIKKHINAGTIKSVSVLLSVNKIILNATKEGDF